MTPFCAAVDWGTTRFRLWLVDAEGCILKEVHSEEGLTTALSVGFEAILEKHLKRLDAPDNLNVVICGMAGARQGWKEARYLDAPADLYNVFENAVKVKAERRDIRILPGIAQRDSERPDVMRGEETQLLGCVSTSPPGNSTNTVCMPGTHSKWVSLDNTRVRYISTYMTGDLFSALSEHTILSMSMQDGALVEPDDQVFLANVERSIKSPQNLNMALFSLRASQLLGYSAPGSGRAALSGALIGMELAGALPEFGNPANVTLLGGGKLSDLYESALAALKIGITRIDAEKAGLAGLVIAAQHFWSENAAVRAALR